MDGKAHLLALGPQAARQLRDRLLRLRHRHAVARHDHDAVGLLQGGGHAIGIDGDLLAGNRHHRTGGGAKAAEDHADEAAVHRLAHDVAQDRTRGADQGAGDDQQVVAEREADRRRRPARVGVEHRDHHRHVGAADAHDQVIADEEGQQRHRHQGPDARALDVQHQQDEREQRRRRH